MQTKQKKQNKQLHKQKLLAFKKNFILAFKSCCTAYH